MCRKVQPPHLLPQRAQMLLQRLGRLLRAQRRVGRALVRGVEAVLQHLGGGGERLQERHLGRRARVAVGLLDQLLLARAQLRLEAHCV